ncbi:MAG: hypothetical protein QXM38_01260 [Candidatus Aenigmatarchaeota archaeon]
MDKRMAENSGIPITSVDDLVLGAYERCLEKAVKSIGDTLGRMYRLDRDLVASYNLVSALAERFPFDPLSRMKERLYKRLEKPRPQKDELREIYMECHYEAKRARDYATYLGLPPQI